MAELADARDLESRPQGCRFKSCCQHQKKDKRFTVIPIGNFRQAAGNRKGMA